LVESVYIHQTIYNQDKKMKNRRIGILFDGVLIILKHKKNLGRCKTVFESFNNKCQRTFLPTRGKNFNLGKENAE